jgi:hypothetical protein
MWPVGRTLAHSNRIPRSPVARRVQEPRRVVFVSCVDAVPGVVRRRQCRVDVRRLRREPHSPPSAIKCAVRRIPSSRAAASDWSFRR